MSKSIAGWSVHTSDAVWGVLLLVSAGLLWSADAVARMIATEDGIALSHYGIVVIWAALSSLSVWKLVSRRRSYLAK